MLEFSKNSIIIRFLIRIAPIAYMYLIWLQSSYFNPEALAGLANSLNRAIILIIGVILELAHLIEFGLLYLFVLLAFLSFGKMKKWKNRVAVMIALLYSLVDEVHQIFIPFRSFSIDDLIKDAIGIFLVWLLIKKWTNIFKEQPAT